MNAAQSLAAGVGWSRGPDGHDAGVAAVRDALAALGGAPPVVALVYATILYDQEAVLRGVRSALPGVPVVGASTQDLARTGDVEAGDRVVGVAVIAGRSVTARTASARDVSRDPELAARALAGRLGPPEPGAPPLLLWYDPLTGINVDVVIATLRAAGYGQILGGGASQPWGRLHRTYQYFDGDVMRDSVVALQLGGDVEMIHDLTHGTDPLGIVLEVTAAEGNVIQTIDGRPAVDIWREQLGLDETAAIDSNSTSAFALGVTLPDEAGAHYEGPITRSVFGFHLAAGEIVLQAPIPAGTQVQVCHRTPEAVHDRATLMATRLHARLAGRAAHLVLGFECAARARPFLGDELTRHEIARMQAILGPDLPWLGMYAWGEVAPVGDTTFFHNFTFPLAVLCLRARTPA